MLSLLEFLKEPPGSLWDSVGVMLVSILCAMGIFGIPWKHLGIIVQILCVFLKHFERMLVILRSVKCSTTVSKLYAAHELWQLFFVFRGLVAMW